MTEINEQFRVETLDEITKEHFEMACIAAMSEDEELCGLLGVPCSSEFVLYEGRGNAIVRVRNWSRHLSLHIVSRNGTWLNSDHIDGMGIEETIAEAYRRFLVAKPYINKECERAFQDMELAEGTKMRWLRGCEEYMVRIRKVLEE